MDAERANGTALLRDMVQKMDSMSNEIRRLRKINKALMGQVERSMDVQGNAFNMFRTSIVLDSKVRDRTLELEAINRELAQAKNAMSRFIAAASHDVLQPINAARIFVSALEERELPPDDRALVANISNAMEATSDLLSSLLDISKLDAGGVSVEISDFRVDKMMESLYQELAPVAKAKGLELRRRPCRAIVRSDPKLVGRVLRNFLNNAIRYTTEGGILLGARQAAGALRVAVWDTGIGIPAEKLGEIFKEFHRLNPRQSGIDSGVGLGLAIVDRIARELGLTIMTHSTPGKGSCFSVILPLGTEGRIPREDGVPIGEPNRGNLEAACILVIDNEPAILVAMKELLRGWNCQPTLAGSGAEALALVRETGAPPDLIIADYHLDDGKTGMSAIRDLCEHFGFQIPFLVATADHGPDVAREINIAGGHLLNKPIKPAKLRALLTHLIRSRPG